MYRFKSEHMKKVIGKLISLMGGRKLIERRYFSGGKGLMVCNYFYKYFISQHKGDFLLHYTSRFNFAEKLVIPKGGKSITIYNSLNYSNACYYQALNGIEIGEGTLWAAGCCFISANHSFTDITKNELAPPIKIGRHVWIGANSVILPGVEIGNYCIVGAGSVVSKSSDAHFILAGVPAKPIAERCRKCLEKIPLGQQYCSSCV